MSLHFLQTLRTANMHFDLVIKTATHLNAISIYNLQALLREIAGLLLNLCTLLNLKERRP